MPLIRPYFVVPKSDTSFQYPPVVSPRLAERSTRLPSVRSTSNHPAGDLITLGYNSNYGERKNARYIFLTATLDAAIWGAELA